MSYVTQQQLVAWCGEEELIQLTDRDQAEVMDPAVIAAAITHADGIINGYLAARYAVPVAPVPELLTSLASAIARHRLHGKSVTDSVRQDYEDAVARLRDISIGRASLPGAAPAPSGQVTGTATGVAAPPRAFTPDRMRGYLE